MDSSTDRARRHTAPGVLRCIDDEAVTHLAEVARKPEAAGARLDALDREWDLDRVIGIEAAVTGLLGLALGVLVSSRLLVVPAAVGASVFLFSLRGRHPLLPVFRRLGVRTAREIERERYAVKALRGDFAALPETRQAEEAGTRPATPGAAQPVPGAARRTGGLH